MSTLKPLLSLRQSILFYQWLSFKAKLCLYLRRAKDFMKRSASQSPDSTLMTFPLALSKNCYSALNLRRSDGGSHKNSIVCCKTGKYLVRSCPSSVCCSQSRLHLRKKSNCHHRQLCTEIIVSHVFCLLSWTPLEKETMLSFLLLYGYASYYYTDRCRRFFQCQESDR